MEMKTRIEKWQRLWKLLQDLRKKEDYPSQKAVEADLDECIALATELRIAEQKDEELGNE